MPRFVLRSERMEMDRTRHHLAHHREIQAPKCMFSMESGDRGKAKWKRKKSQENEEMIELMQKMGKEAKDILREEEERGSGSAQQLIGPFYKWVCF